MKQYIKRKLQTEIEKWIDRPEILAIRGPRQSGKSTLLNHLHLFLINKKKISSDNIFYINFEDKNKLINFSKDPASYIKSFFKSNDDNFDDNSPGDLNISNQPTKKYYFLLDEYQYIKDGGSKLKLLYDTYKNVKHCF